MSELIVDKERGLTALDMLSTTYKKAADLAKKSSKAALSLVLIFFGFLGFNSFNNAAQLPVQTINEVQNVTELEPSAPVETEGSAAPSPSAEGSASPSASSSATPKDVSAVVNAKAPVLK
ncbi:MAG: hypothetical protein ACK55I_04625, partial [bacterium]